jgi:hypothetical protein
MGALIGAALAAVLLAGGTAFDFFVAIVVLY